MIDEIAAITEMVKDLDRNRKELNIYFSSQEFKNDLSIVKSFFESHPDEFSIDSETAAYFPKTYPISAETLLKMVDAVYANTERCLLIDEKHNPFPHVVILHEGLIFRIISGQGTVFSICDKKKYNEFQNEIDKITERSQLPNH